MPVCGMFIDVLLGINAANAMEPDQTLSDIARKVLRGISLVLTWDE